MIPALQSLNKRTARLGVLAFCLAFWAAVALSWLITIQAVEAVVVWLWGLGA